MDRFHIISYHCCHCNTWLCKKREFVDRETLSKEGTIFNTLAETAQPSIVKIRTSDVQCYNRNIIGNKRKLKHKLMGYWDLLLVTLSLDKAHPLFPSDVLMIAFGSGGCAAQVSVVCPAFPS